MAENNLVADKSIQELPQAEDILDTDLFLLQSGGVAKKLTGRQFLDFCLDNTSQVYYGPDEPNDVKIWITPDVGESPEPLYTARVEGTRLILKRADAPGKSILRINNNGKWHGVPAIGIPGRGVEKIERTDRSGLVDHYEITYDDGTGDPDGFDVTNAKSITEITGPVVDGKQRTYTIKFNDNSEFQFSTLDGSGTINTVNGQVPSSTGALVLYGSDISMSGADGKKLDSAIREADLTKGGTVTGNLSVTGDIEVTGIMTPSLLSPEAFAFEDFTNRVVFDPAVGVTDSFFLRIGDFVYFNYTSLAKNYVIQSVPLFIIPIGYCPGARHWYPCNIASTGASLTGGAVVVESDGGARYEFGGVSNGTGFLFVSGFYRIGG